MTVEQLVWLALAAVLFIAEAATVNLVTIWFAIGAIAALIAAFLGAELLLQIIIFLAVTLITLIATRPLVKNHFNNRHTPTNADSLIGETCIVTETISSVSASGMVICKGNKWSAASADGSDIPEGASATVTAIKGVRLVVKKIEE